jgi:endo-beta-N-acetylglucosaminidase D
MLKAAQRTVSSVTKEQIEERSRNVMFTAEELSEFEDITDAVYDEEISEETTVKTAEDEEKKYTVPETLENVTADNDNDDIIQENKSVVTVQPVSEVSDSGLTAEKQQEILETALMIENSSINKERITLCILVISVLML